MLSQRRLVIVGGGIIGTMHAYFGLKAGYEVVQVDRDPEALSASVRNFGLIWVSGRAEGKELALALRARELWEEVGLATDIGFRGNGSLTIARNDSEFSVLQEAAAMEDADARGFEILHRNEVRELEPILQGDFVGGLRCTQDAAVEPQMLFKGLREFLLKKSHYSWVPNFDVVKFRTSESGHHIENSQSEEISGDRIIFAPGTAHFGFLSEYTTKAPLRRVFCKWAPRFLSTIRWDIHLLMLIHYVITQHLRIFHSTDFHYSQRLLKSTKCSSC